MWQVLHKNAVEWRVPCGDVRKVERLVSHLMMMMMMCSVCGRFNSYSKELGLASSFLTMLLSLLFYRAAEQKKNTRFSFHCDLESLHFMHRKASFSIAGESANWIQSRVAGVKGLDTTTCLTFTVQILIVLNNLDFQVTFVD